jgi:hypothetical protein
MKCVNVTVQGNNQLDIKEQEKQEHLELSFNLMRNQTNKHNL